ncbi:MAG: hypothetical protein ABS35_24775 [Kaistia sp. SCN 65-12]|nr:MAG: hypothetical protein ABS35_24775 [Kaistia sp. SCN 65-12]
MTRALSNPVRVSAPLQGVDGRTVLAKARAPLVTDGRIGDFWIDTVAKKLYGPKSAGGWPDNGLIKGDRGWVPLLAAVTDGTRRVHRIVDWSGGEGTKPATGSYVGATGLVADIADAVDMRGPQGPAMLIDALVAGGDDIAYDDNVAIAKVGDDNERQPLKRLLGAGGLLQFETVAEAEALVVPASVKAVQINGANSAEGGAGHIRRRVDSEPTIGPKHRSADRFTSDGSSDAANGGWWSFVEDRSFLPVPAVNFIRGIGDKLRERPHLRDFGAVGDGVTDDTAKIQAAIDFLAAKGGGEIDCSGGRWLIDSGELLVKDGVFLKGVWQNLGERTNRDYSTLDSFFLLNPTYTIRMLAKGCGLRGVGILPKGYSAPTTMRQAKDMVAGWSGTAVTIGDGVTSGIAQDAYIGYCFIGGFAQGISCVKNERPRMEYLALDNLNNIYMDFVPDKNHLSHCHGWPFLTARINPISYAVSGASDNGSGKVRLAIPANQVAAGDVVHVVNVVGTTEANGRQTVLAATASYIDIDVAFASAWVSDGTVYLSAWSRQKNIVFRNVVDHGQADFCFSFGYDVGFDVEGCDHVVFLKCGADNFGSLQDATTIGFKVGANARSLTLSGCKASAMGRGVVNDLGTAYNEAFSATIITACDFWGNVTNDIHQITGRSVIVANKFSGIRAGANVQIDANSGGTVCHSNDGGGMTNPISVSGQALRLSTIGCNNWADAAVGDRRVFNNALSKMVWDRYGAGGIELAGRSAQGSAFTPTVSLINDQALRVSGWFFDGSATLASAAIDFELDGTPGANDVPGRIVFRTALDGTATLSERMRLDNAGRLGIGTTAPSTDALVTLAGAQGTSQAIAFIGFGSDSDAAILNTNGVFTIKTGASSTVAGMQDRFQVKTTGAVRLVPISADPPSPVDGDIWINSTAGRVRARIGGVTVDLN